ncbi:hypothetical protein [Planctomicrobium sp. SH664]|uniref:hypothetical protein n=1 Tax=Planctomicrobium sp. SH664 TaxID=3448125 RepID=UPI003F5C5661
MLRCLTWLTVVTLLTTITPRLQAETPAAAEPVIEFDELQLLVKRHVDKLTEILVTEESFNEKKSPLMRQSLGLIACIGQYLAEHPQLGEGKLNGPALRDAALIYKRNGSYADAQSALAQIQEVVSGKVTGEHAVEHPWNKLTGLGAAMEEINVQNPPILNFLKRPRGTPEEPLSGITWYLLSKATLADTHEVKDPAKLPEWNQYATEFSNASGDLVTALRAKDKAGDRKAFDLGKKTCNTCHEAFQH